MTIKQFGQWLITSSEDPRRVSLAVKGFLVLAGSQLVRVLDTACQFGLSCVGIDTNLVNQMAEGAELVVYAAMLLVGSIWALYGLLRKTYLGQWSSHG
jgi:hypothetical protein